MRYTEAENEIIRQHYKTHGAKACAKLLPGRSFKAVTIQAGVLGVRSESKIKGKSTLWTAADIAVLRDHYPKTGASGVAVILVNRTERAIAGKCCELGIAGPSVTAATKRAMALRSIEQKTGAPVDSWPVQQRRVEAGQWKAEPVNGPRSVFDLEAA